MKNSLLDTPGTLRPIFRLAWPVLAEELLNMLVGYTDWWLTGHYLEGPSYKAAMGLMAYLLWIIPCLFSGIAIGTTAMVSRAMGAGDRQAANRIMHQSFLAGAVASVVITGLVAGWGGQFIVAMRLSAEAVPHAQRYLAILVPVIPAIMLEQVAIAALRGAGDTATGLMAKSIVNLVNAVVSTSLVIGWGPFPCWGWEGLAIGTALGHAVGACVLVAAIIFGRGGLRFQRIDFRPDVSLMKRLVRVGTPGGLDVLAVLACHLAYVRVVNSLGTVAAASHGLGLQIEALAYLPGSAFSVAAATLTGQLLGAKDPARATRLVRNACLLDGIAMSTAGLLFFFAGQRLAAFFTGGQDPDTEAGAAMYLRIVAFSMPSLAVLHVLTGALRGAGDTIWPLLVTFAGMLLIRVPGSYLLSMDSVPVIGTNLVVPGLGIGVAGAWYAMLIDVVVRSCLVSARFYHGGWRRVIV